MVFFSEYLAPRLRLFIDHYSKISPVETSVGEGMKRAEEESKKCGEKRRKRRKRLKKGQTRRKGKRGRRIREAGKKNEEEEGNGARGEREL